MGTEMTDRPNFSRRSFVAGAAVALSGSAWFSGEANARTVSVPSRYGLGDFTGFAVLDRDGGSVFEEHRANAPLPPASVLKLATTLYGIHWLGPDYRFETTVLADGPVVGGVLEGNLILCGGGDPVLDTDDLHKLALGLAELGIRRITGRFQVCDTALPRIEFVDPQQPHNVGYNPAVSGLNLNFNRVKLAWEVENRDLTYRFLAPGRNIAIEPEDISGVIGKTGVSVYHRDGISEKWTLPGRSMTGKGSVWLPVRCPGRYAGGVFRSICATVGLELPPLEMTRTHSGADVLLSHKSPPLDDLLRGVLRYSTNLTAEIIGLRASQIKGDTPQDLADSARAMTHWVREHYGLTDARFVDHSGLSDGSRWSAAEAVRVLSREAERLPDLLRSKPVMDAPRKGRPLARVDLRAKSGTLFFASGLAGYVDGPGRKLAFAVFSADLDKRSVIDPMVSSAPGGARAWRGRAHLMQQDLLRQWLASGRSRQSGNSGLRPVPRPG